MPSRRLVAVVISADHVLDPASDLHRVAAGAAEVDVLVARVDRPAEERGPTAPTALDAPDYEDDTAGGVLAGFTVPLDPAAIGQSAARHRRLEPGPPETLRVHRLDLAWRLRDEDTDDLVAALSELVGFDPDDGVFCVAPVAGPADPEAVVLARAVGRVARVYGLPVLRYHTAGDAGVIVPPVAARPEPVV